MSKGIYLKLAVSNIKKNSKIYIPYMITCIFSAIVFYILSSLSQNPGLENISGSMTTKTILFFGNIVVGIFVAIFLFYTNSFLIKRRKKELGLYNVLGLGKNHIAKILFFEKVITLVVTLVVTLVLGIFGGVVLDKFMFLLLSKLLRIDIKLGFHISKYAVILSIIIFSGIFIVTLFSDLLQIKYANSIEILKSGEQGEKEPKTKIFMALIGILTLSLGYGMSVTIEHPVKAINVFFIAVLLVIIGTYGIFTAGSIAILKLLRKNKKFYYKKKNFIAVSSMIYRMKQNAVGLANICILSTMVLVTLSTTTSLYVGVEDSLSYMYPKDIFIVGEKSADNDNAKNLEKIVFAELKEGKEPVKDLMSYELKSKTYNNKKDGDLKMSEKGDMYSDFLDLTVISTSDYNKIEGKNINLKDDEALIFSSGENYHKESITVDGKKLNIKGTIDENKFIKKYENEIFERYLLVVNNIDNIIEDTDKSHGIEFNLDKNDEEISALSERLNQKIANNNITAEVTSIADNRGDFFSLYGAFFFIDLLLGSLFLVATVLIIYYKQISEGYDDRKRFEIMKKVGMSDLEIRKTIRKQVLMVFFIPIIIAAIHVAFACPIIIKLLSALNLMNSKLFIITIIITVMIFAIVYGIVFSLTAKAYYKIVQ